MSQQQPSAKSTDEKKETLVEAVQRTENEYKNVLGALLDAKDSLASVQARMKDLQDAAMKSQLAFSMAKERHMMSIIQQQTEQLKASQTQQQRPDNVLTSSDVIVDMKGKEFDMTAK